MPASYSGGTKFVSCPSHRLAWDLSWFSSVPPEKWQKSSSNWFTTAPSHSSSRIWTARMYLSIPLHFLLILHFTSPSIFPYLSFIFYVVCYIFKAHKNIWTDRRTDARFWLAFTSQNNALDNKLPRTRVSNPRPMATCVKYVSTHYKNGTTINP